VLVDSESVMNVVFTAMLNEIGLRISPEESLRRFLGRSNTSCREIIEAELGRPIAADFLQSVEHRAAERFVSELQTVPGTVELMDALDVAGIPYGVASSGTHEKMHTTLGITGLLPRLRDRLTSATEVSRGKPAPDVFLLAASRLNTPPERCVVIEDSVFGIAAARAAGMQSIAYAAMLGVDTMRDAGPTHIVTSMRDVFPLIAAK
jgi:HAD superfamily hydrolase (TIGR01509 family)